jgi:hypothetical protein
MPDDDKIRLPDMMLWVGSEVTRLEAWETVLTEEGKQLDPGKARDLAVARKALETLELLQMYQDKFVAMVQQDRDRHRREMKSTAPAKKASGSAPPQEMEAESAPAD